MGGGVRRVSLDSFLRRDRIMAIHDPPAGTDRQRLAEFARAHWRERTPFDGVFDARDASRFYCVEFVARALEFASAPPTPLVSVNRNPSVGVALHWLRVDSGQLLLAGELIAQQRRAALISRSRSADEVAAYFARKAEIHRRFDEQARLGDVLSWGWQRLKLRPVIERYFAATTHDDAYALAERTFGHDAGNGLQVRAR
jgi:hypothetical protein